MSAHLIERIAPEFMRWIGPLCGAVIVKWYCLFIRIVNMSIVASGTGSLILASPYPQEYTESYKQHDSCNTTNHRTNDAGHRRFR